MINNIDNVIFFDNDDELYTWASPYTHRDVIQNPETGEYETKYNIITSKAYNDAITNNNQFIIRDENSRIYKHECLECGMNLPLTNLLPYYKGITEIDYDPEHKYFN